ALDSSSSRGLRTDPTTFPDLSAPGATITSACGPQLPVCYLHGDTGDDNREYYTIGGTSMAAPHVAGIVAQLLEADPTLTPGKIELLLEDTAYKFTAGGKYGEQVDATNPDDTTSFDKGHGLVDAKAAVASLRGIPGVQAVDPVQTDACAADGPVMTDARGDGTDLGVAGAAPNEPALDVRSLSLSWDDAADELTFRLAVDDLGALNPPGAPNASYNTTFVYDGFGYYVEAVRSAAGTTSFGVGLMETVDATVTSAVVRAPGGTLSEGSFDADADTVSIVLPSSALEALGAPALSAGATLRDLDGVSRRSATPALFGQGPSTDVGEGSCAFTLGVGAVEPPPEVPPVVAADGEVSKGGASYAWTGNPPLDANISPFVDVPCILPDDPRCDNEHVRVVLEPGSSGTLRITVGAAVEGDDFGFALYDPDGTFVDGVDTGDRVEVLEVPVSRAGVYRVAVWSFLSLDGSYEGTATLT
ncbi:MAG TPA: S8 family serine peptidase, partial [Acidimicrobiales bacterium]